MADLTPYHLERLEAFVQFSKSKREESLRELDLAIDEFKDTSVTEDHFVRSDVISILDKLTKTVRTTVDKEVSTNQYASSVLLQSIFSQADKLNIQLKVDVASLENGEALRSMAKFEQEKTKIGAGQKLPSLGKSAADPAVLLQEINTLKEENKVLRDRLQKLTGQSTSVLKEKSAANEELEQLKIELSQTKSRESAAAKDLSTLKGKVDELQQQIGQLKVAASTPAVKADPSVQAALQAKSEEVDQLQKELTGKVQSTTQFATMKKMVQKKNDQVKDLLTRLRKYEPAATVPGGEDDE
eukprot:TRINITY_DN4770_c0_g1_i1.p1 TRINITY_DN4770_c0_g1~~TRINITY_DN4770_c0_g1_i1.p1  ORF type:complete len:299 (-),score=98.89 TRINITY_DN4770_c0_g1_i1:594-1490(-)